MFNPFASPDLCGLVDGVARQAPYLHHGAVGSLDAMFDPDRAEPGHDFGLDLDDEDRAALLAYLRSI